MKLCLQNEMLEVPLAYLARNNGILMSFNLFGGWQAVNHNSWTGVEIPPQIWAGA